MEINKNSLAEQAEDQFGSNATSEPKALLSPRALQHLAQMLGRSHLWACQTTYAAQTWAALGSVGTNHCYQRCLGQLHCHQFPSQDGPMRYQKLTGNQKLTVIQETPCSKISLLKMGYQSIKCVCLYCQREKKNIYIYNLSMSCVNKEQLQVLEDIDLAFFFLFPNFYFIQLVRTFEKDFP